MFPFSDSATRHPSSLHRLPRGSVRRLHGYYRGAPTSCRPSQRISFPSCSCYHGLPSLARQRGVAVSGSSSELRRCLNPLPSISLVETTGSPRFLGNPFANMLGSSTPADRMHQAPLRCTRCCLPRGSRRRLRGDLLSRLHRRACSLAVYASQLGLLRSHHARLASR